ncbi:MAG: hypothetical protein MSIBF_02975 [Candidatus Altiarchaeales archaeon IMC4]|nr:MAG: hypothetical protein MSIBF_02975 [Candidatus Altiarchaeales archaeon IMC4]
MTLSKEHKKFAKQICVGYNPARDCGSDAEKASQWIMENTNKTDILYVQDEYTALAYYTNRKIILAPFNKTVFFNPKTTSMEQDGYYVYFEKQDKNERFPKTEEIANDQRFRLVELVENKEGVYIYEYKSI